MAVLSSCFDSGGSGAATAETYWLSPINSIKHNNFHFNLINKLFLFAFLCVSSH
jgi:hypothetical protein